MDNLQIIVISGLPGSGKSTIAEAIAEKKQFPVLSVDPIESSILKSGIPKSFESGLAAYLVVQKLASEQLKIGISVVIDAVSSVKEARDMWHDLEKTYHAQLSIIECILDSEIHKKRLSARTRKMHGIPEVTWEDVEKRKKEYLPWQEKRLVLDSSESHKENLDKALKYIESNKIT